MRTTLPGVPFLVSTLAACASSVDDGRAPPDPPLTCSAPKPAQPGAPGHRLISSTTFSGTGHIGGVATDRCGGAALVGTADDVVFGSDHVGQGPADTEPTFVARLDPHGTPLWGKQLDGAEGVLVAIAPDGDTLVAGRVDGTLRIGDVSAAGQPGIEAPFVARFGTAGELRWLRAWPQHAGSASNNIALTADSSGAVLIASSYEGAFDIGLGPLPTQPQIAGYIAKLDAEGTTVWVHPTSFPCSAIALGPDDGVYAACVDNVPYAPTLHLDAKIVALDSSGAMRWSRSTRGVQSDAALASSPGGGVLLGATYVAPLDLGDGPLTTPDYGLLVATLAADGSLTWTSIGDGNLLLIEGLAARPHGGVMALALFEDTVHVGGQSFVDTAQKPSALLVRLDPSAGHALWGEILPGEVSGFAVDARGATLVGGPALDLARYAP